MKIRRSLSYEALNKIAFVSGSATLWLTIFAICAAECVPLSLTLFALAGAAGALTAHIEKQIP